jgi:hypothetical protein
MAKFFTNLYNSLYLSLTHFYLLDGRVVESHPNALYNFKDFLCGYSSMKPETLKVFRSLHIIQARADKQE